VSNTSGYTEYNYTINLSGGDEYTTFTLFAGGGMTDALALDVLVALNGISWPSGTTVALAKVDRGETDYVTDLTATPPAFT
jgi:fumarate reductase subunit D